MRIVITGGAGFLGRKLAAALLARGTLTDARGAQRTIKRITLVDVVAAPAAADPRLRSIAGDLADPALVDAAIEDGADSVFHLAAVVSGEAETNFDLGWRVNVDATRLLLERCRALPAPPKFVFTSSCAVFGGPLPDPVPDDQALWPQSSYGNQKAVGEFLVYDFTRKGFIDGRTLRLPTISVRPGKANKAASSFASGILREPLNGVDAICPVSRSTRMWLLSPRAVIANMIVGHEAPADAFAHTRSINVPGISIPVEGMIEALRRVAGDAVADHVVWRHDPAIDRIVQTWPVNFDTRLGHSLGMAGDIDFDSIVRQYIADELPRRGQAATVVTPR
jgi:nucleoside-diphosphate-sugar epimerase